MAFIESFGSYLPPRIVPNSELAAILGCTPEWIVQASGISERRFASNDESVADLAAQAAQACLARAGRPASDVRLLIAASGSEPRRFPGIASVVAHRLGLEETPALDVPVASAGGLIGMVVGDAMAATYGVVLVVASEKMSEVILRDPLNRNVAILFGDGAGACLLNAEQGLARIEGHVLHSGGAYANSLALQPDGTLSMDGRAVILQASRKLPRAIAELLDRHRLSPAAVSAFLMHQANQNLLDGVARSLQVPAERFFSNIARYGNTSSASLFIAAAEWEETHGFSCGSPVVLSAFGAGFHWGALLATGV
jgi:3-oxoacyl-[acyl-carrier-protein] synthase-3